MSSVHRIQGDLNDTRDILVDVTVQLAQRGTHLQNVLRTSEALSGAGEVLRQRATELNCEHTWTALVLGACLFIVFFIVFHLSSRWLLQ